MSVVFGRLQSGLDKPRQENSQLSYSSKRGGGASFSWKCSVPDWLLIRSPDLSLLCEWESSDRMVNWKKHKKQSKRVRKVII